MCSCHGTALRLSFAARRFGAFSPHANFNAQKIVCGNYYKAKEIVNDIVIFGDNKAATKNARLPDFIFSKIALGRACTSEHLLVTKTVPVKCPVDFLYLVSRILFAPKIYDVFTEPCQFLSFKLTPCVYPPLLLNGIHDYIYQPGL